jgi:capsid assembly protease
VRYEHILAEFRQTAWAILPETLEIIESLVLFRVEGGRLTPEEIMARTGGRPAAKQPTRTGGVAVLPVYGVINHRMNMMSDMSGGTSIEKLTAQFREALADPAVASIVLDVDSPGGSVTGVQELADEIYAARAQKQIAAQVNPQAASAAYWLASAASEIVSIPSGEAGSIGIFVPHTDYSKALEEAGVKKTLISAGKYKVEGNPFEPLTEEARAYLQSRVDQYYGPFVSAVARGRGVPVANVREGFGQGRMAGAQDALAMGMIDRVATLDQTVERLLGGSVKGAITSIRVQVPELPAAETTVETPASAETTKEVAMSTTVTPAAAAADALLAAEQARVSSIIQLANRSGMADKAPGWVRENKSVEAVQAEILDKLSRSATPMPQPEPGPQVHLTEKESRDYSIMRLIRSLASSNQQLGIKAESAGFEMEVSAAIAKKMGRDGIFVPTNLRNIDRSLLSEAGRATLDGMNQRYNATLTGGGSPGSSLVQTTIMATEFIDLLRNLQVVYKAGARRLSDLQGNVALPKQTGAATLYWTGENPGSAVTETDQNFTQVLGSPKQAMAQTAYSRMFLIQSTLDAEQIIREDLAMINALGIDLAALVGTGSSNQPKGISNQTGTNYEYCGGSSGGNGGAITYDLITQAQADIELSNVPETATSIVTTPRVKKKLRNLAELSNTISLPVWHSDNTVGGWNAFASNQLPATATYGSSGALCNMLIAGAWNNLIIAEWGAMEIIADPFTQAGKGNVVLTTSVLIDIMVRYAQAFTVIPDILPAS